MSELNHLFENNRNWAEKTAKEHEGFFEKLANQQKPDYLWIGCSDSRVPANELLGLLPGEVFVHRNVANMVIHTDFNCLSVLQYAVEHLKVKDIIICGHYDCGGVHAAMDNSTNGFINNWLHHLRDIYNTHADILDEMTDSSEKLDRLCELNVVEQVKNIGRTTIAKEAWARGQELTVHGVIYNIGNGLLQDLDISVKSFDDLRPTIKGAIGRILNPEKK